MTSTINLICFKCKHWKAFETGCNAFDEIPDQVLLENKHDKKLKGQKNDLIFEEGTPTDLPE